jgi:hypothetical protein
MQEQPAIIGFLVSSVEQSRLLLAPFTFHFSPFTTVLRVGMPYGYLLAL